MINKFIPFNPFNPKKYINAIAEELKDNTSSFWHCTYGVDRTSHAVGVKLLLDGVPMHKVMQNMKEHGFKGIHRVIFFPMEMELRRFAKTLQKAKINA